MSERKKVAVVAGATRGAGRGIARALGEAGYAVACTGRSLRGAPSPYGMPETLEETAAMIPGAVAIRVDHTREEEVAALFARVERELGPVEVVADSVAGEDPALGAWTGMAETDLGRGEAALRQGLLARAITAKHAALAMRPRGRGLLVEITEHDLPLGAGGNLISALVKGGIKLLAATLAEELREHGVAVVSLTPGFLRSEAMLRHFGVTRETWRDAGAQDPHFLCSESPLFVGRAVAALAADPGVLARTGGILSSWELAREHGFTDEDGARPDWGAHWRDAVLPELPAIRRGTEHQAAWLEALARRARDQLAGPALADADGAGVLAAIEPERFRPLKRSEYDRMIALGLFQDERLELIRGVLVKMSPQRAPHASTVERLTELLVRQLAGRFRVRIQLPLALSDDSEPAPDVAIVPLGDHDREHPTTALLIVEVADTSLKQDRAKAAVYASAGIGECWIVNLDARTVEVHAAPDGDRYAEVRTLRAGDLLRPAALPGLGVEVAEILPKP